jgi:hypothetical protein
MFPASIGWSNKNRTRWIQKHFILSFKKIRSNIARNKIQIKKRRFIRRVLERISRFPDRFHRPSACSGKNSFPFGATKTELATLWVQWEPNMPDNSHQEFLQFYKPIHSRFVKFCSSMAYGRMETQDLVQETVLVVMQKWDKIQKKDSLLAFMVGTAGRILQNQGRKSRRETGLDAEKDSLRKLEAKTMDPEIGRAHV